MATVEDFKLKVEECRRQAQAATVKEHREMLLQMAAAWEKIARYAASRKPEDLPP